MLLIRENQFHNSCNLYEVDNYMEYIYDCVKNPVTEASSKTDLNHWAFYELVDEPEYDVDGELFFLSRNLKSCEILLIDFDDGITYDSMYNKYKDEFYFAIHTTFNHSQAKEKFRMLIPLKRPIYNEYFKVGKVRDYFFKLFPEADPHASFKTLQGNCMPAIKNGSEYRYNVSNETDKMFDVDLDYFEKCHKEMDAIGKENLHDFNFTELYPISSLKRTFRESEFVNYVTGKLQEYASQLQTMDYARGSGVDVHGLLRSKAYFMQRSKYENWEKFMLTHIPEDEQNSILVSEISRFRFK